MNDTSSAGPILKIENLTKRFGHGDNAVAAVRHVDLTVEKGEFVAVMGASGSGKSTLLHLVAGLTRPDEGIVRINGTDICTMKDSELTLFRRKNIGLVFQAFNLIPSLTGEENIALPALLGGERGAPGDVAALISRLGLGKVGKRTPDSMSGGEQQRIAIGRALIGKPLLILADEPTGSLDSANGRKLCELFRKLCEESGTTVLMVTHNPIVAFSADRFLVLEDGMLVSSLDRKTCPTLQDLNRAYIDIIEKCTPEEVSA